MSDIHTAGAAPDLPALGLHAAATATLRETTKWLIATLTALGLIVSVGEGLLDAAAIPDGDWRAIGVAVSCVGIAAAGLVAVFGARVLIGKSESWAKTLTKRHATDLDQTLNEGAVLWPWGYGDVAAWFDEHAQTVLDDQPASATSVRLIGEVMEFLNYQETRRRFKCFIGVVVAAAIVTIASTTVVSRIVADHTPSGPTQVELV